MRQFLLLALLWISCRAYSDDLALNQSDDNWRIVKNGFLFSAEFECKKGEETISKVIRTGTIRYHYYLFDASDELQATGITRAFSWGAIVGSAMEIDVWEGDFYLGKIEGDISSFFAPKFTLYDCLGNKAVVAHMSSEFYEFAIVSAQDEAKRVADLQFLGNGCEWGWEMKMKEPIPQIDPRILRIFAAFVADYLP